MIGGAVSDQPVEISPAKLAQLSPSTGTALPLGGIWGQVESGQTWLANDGRRMIVSADSTAVIFVLGEAKNPALTNKIFIQSSRGFREEVRTYPFAEAGRRASPMARMAELEMQILIGICGATSGLGFAAVLGADLLDFLVKNRDNFNRWSKAASACLACRAVLKKHAPTLYDKLIDATFLAAAGGLAESAKNIPEAAAKDTKLIGRLVGAVIGKLGKKATTARLSALGAIWIVLSDVVKKALSAVPGAVKISVDEKTKSADALISELKKANVRITPEEARRIVEEVVANSRELGTAHQQLRDAFSGITAQ